MKEGRVWGWDDPRMPTLSGLRRRGYTPEALRLFCERIGAKVQQAFVDVEKGVVDTDKGPVLEDLARKDYPPK